MGSISFVASLSANVNNKAGNTGAFIFTHSIVTNNGSYDVAEDYPTRDNTLEPGDVVSIDINERGFVVKSNGAYDYTAIGIYSEKPALIIGMAMEDYSGPSVGKVLAYIKSSSYNGSIADTFANININSDTFAQDVLASLNKENSGLYNSDILTDRLIASLEIISPKITTDTLIAKTIKAEKIEGLDLLISNMQIANI